MSAVLLSRLKGLNNVGRMLLPSLGAIQFLRLFHKNLRELCLEPIPFFSAHTKIPAGLSVDPVVEIDPVFDLIGTFPVPCHIFGEMAVRLCRIVAEPFQHVDTYLLFFHEPFML